MKKAALYVKGKIVVGFNHGDAFGKLNQKEQYEEIISGFFDEETEEFQSESEHFFDKNLLLLRHAIPDDEQSPDPNISKEGESQIKELASSLRNIDLDDYYFAVSPFLRCLRTAEILQESLDLKISVEPLIAETPKFLEDDQEFILKNRSIEFQQFDWKSTNDFVLTRETQKAFRDRTLFVLKRLPHRCMLITHFGVICNITKLALCEQKARTILKEGIPPASITHIQQHEVRKLDYENKCQSRPKTSLK